MLGERHLANMVRWNTGTSEEDQQKTPTRPMSPIPDLAVVRTRATKDSAEGERETGGSGEIKIIDDNETTPRTHGTQCGNILYLHGTPFNVEIGGEVLARGREKEGEPADGHAIRPRADNTVEDGLNKIVTMLKDNKTVGDAHNDVQFEGNGGDIPPHVHKIYKPRGHPQIDTKEHRPTMTVMGVEASSHREHRVDRVGVSEKNRNVTTEYKENFGEKVIRRGASDTPESYSTMVDFSWLHHHSCEGRGEIINGLYGLRT